ncbi:DUF3662 and FHA domain-containing protein [Gleimia hominis]|uniref:DUF3662 and FHA domain-containing protein n=1 Tax=Gleimia hominis TaxID=595468 RepID=A0ABU3I8V6_9ACTO|nr:DUF3662 and FHA domain-containing protein [Gleimia hominis]MDT3766809.1 DUF3662 and FHA domain-containing protein [Gleimia hominis]
MGLLDRFESTVEKGVNGIFSRVFRSALKPVDITSAVRKSMENHVQEYSQDHQVVPNEYRVKISPSDMRNLEDMGLDVLAQEIQDGAMQYAQDNDYALVGPIKVSFEPGSEELTGQLQIDASTRRGAVAPATSQSASTQNPIIDIEGERWILTEPVTIIGRGRSADITVNDSGVSREHLELRQTPGGVIATDLGSTNGLYVEGHKVDAATLVDGNQIVIGRTRILFWTSAAEDQ